MTILDQAEQLRQQAIALLLQEREMIDQKLNQLGGAKSTEQKKARTCSKCGQNGHNAKTCPASGEPSA